MSRCVSWVPAGAGGTKTAQRFTAWCNLLAGTDESPGLIISRNGRRMKVARGMASMEAALDRSICEVPEHGRANWDSTEVEVPTEGVEAPMAYRGSARGVLQHLLLGLRSGMSYSGASTIQDLWQNARFVRQTEAGFRESGSHALATFRCREPERSRIQGNAVTSRANRNSPTFNQVC